eukprot:11168_1
MFCFRDKTIRFGRYISIAPSCVCLHIMVRNVSSHRIGIIVIVCVCSVSIFGSSSTIGDALVINYTVLFCTFTSIMMCAVVSYISFTWLVNIIVHCSGVFV